MPSFINLNSVTVVNRDYILYHFYFVALWWLLIGVIFFRVDAIVVKNLAPEQIWILYLVPIFLILIVYFFLKKLQWYFKLAFIFYIPLLIFWFIPKLILQKGKFYLFAHYVNVIIRRIKKWKSTILHSLFFLTVIILLSNVPNTYVRIISIAAALYLLVRYNYRFAMDSFKPEGLIGIKILKFITYNKTLKVDSENTKRFASLERIIKAVEKDDLTKEEIQKKQLYQIVAFYTTIEAFRSSLKSLKTTLSFVLYWLITFSFSMAFTILVISFINYQLFQLDHGSFVVKSPLGFCEFIRYTAKCLTYGDIEEIRPISGVAKIIEGSTFFIVGIFYLLIIVTFGYNYSASRVEEEKKEVIEVLDQQLIIAKDFSLHKFGKEYEEIMDEFSEINESVKKLKKAFERFI